MKTAYFDCFCGIAGDMILGSLIDAGLPMAHLKRELGRLELHGYSLERKRIRGAEHIAGTNLHVKVRGKLDDARYTSIARMIKKSDLKPAVKTMSLLIVERLAEADARVRGVSLKRVRFDEVGAIDVVIDCVGAAIGFDYFNCDTIVASPLPIAKGRIRGEHGWQPNPAPATMHLLKGVPLASSPIRDEIVTPTGAAIITTVAEHFGACPLQQLDTVGYGYGDRIFPDIPNVLRLMIGQGFPVMMIEATIDDMNPQFFDYVMERLFEVGAVDMTLTPVQMKKNRPGIILSCQAPSHLKDAIIEVILAETTTTGVRYYPIDRHVMLREMKTVKTKHGKVRIKIARDEKLGIIKHIPEYEDLKRIAKRKKIPLIEVYKEFNRGQVRT